jgi:hypothetical protein
MRQSFIDLTEINLIYSVTKLQSFAHFCVTTIFIIVIELPSRTQIISAYKGNKRFPSKKPQINTAFFSL